MNINDTIVAISTPVGQGGLGVIRLSGKKAIQITDSIFSAVDKKTLKSAKTHSMHHGWIRFNKTIIDEVLVSIMHNPRSYTGEDVVEISAHGGPIILNKILELCILKHARIAMPGEFTYRAFINNKMDLSRAESVADLISSKTAISAQVSMNILKGALSKKIYEWKNNLIDILSKLEVALDYAEEDIKFITKNQLRKELLKLKNDASRLIKTSEKNKYLKDGIKIAIIGRPNTGKSSLLNLLMERERSIVTNIPGTTRDIIEELIDCRGIPLVLMDTAGLRPKTSDRVEKIGQSRTLECIKNADFIIWIVDGSEKLKFEDIHIFKTLVNMKILAKTLLLQNKIDKKTKLSTKELKKYVKHTYGSAKISAKTGDGLRKLENKILDFTGRANNYKEGQILINQRHANILDKARKQIEQALNACLSGKSEEYIAFHIREILNILGEITGETTTEDILENIFSKFCVGK